MTVQLSRWLASAGFLLLVPASIWLAYVGSDYGFYPRIVVPVAFGLILAAGIVALFAVLPVLRRREREPDEDDR